MMSGLHAYHPAGDLRTTSRSLPSPLGFAAATAFTALAILIRWGQEEDQRQAAEAGFDHHLTKPADLDRIRALLAAPLPPPVN